MHAPVIWAKDHPLLTGVLVIGGGLLVLSMLKGGGGGGGGDGSAVGAYYAAESAQAQSGNALMATQIAAQASTAQALSRNQTDLGINSLWAAVQKFAIGEQTTQAAGANATQITLGNLWANTQLATTESNNQAAMSEAAYGVENTLIGTLGQVASLPPTTTTTTKKSGGFGLFGLSIGGGAKTSTQITPNPASVQASGALTSMLNGMLAGH